MRNERNLRSLSSFSTVIDVIPPCSPIHYSFRIVVVVVWSSSPRYSGAPKHSAVKSSQLFLKLSDTLSSSLHSRRKCTVEAFDGYSSYFHFQSTLLIFLIRQPLNLLYQQQLSSHHSRLPKSTLSRAQLPYPVPLPSQLPTKRLPTTILPCGSESSLIVPSE